jgi:hypothetical protein
MTRNFETKKVENKPLSGSILKLGKKPLRLNCTHIHKLDKSGIPYEKRTILGRNHGVCGSTASKRYHVSVNPVDFDRALTVIKE